MKRKSRRTSFLLILLLILGSAIFLYLFALKVDKKYSELIVIETENSESIDKISHISDESIFLLFTTLESSNIDSISAYKRRFESYIIMNDTTFTKLSSKIFLKGQNKKAFSNTIESEKSYDSLCNLFFDIKHSGSKDSCLSFLNNIIIPSYKAYQSKIASLLALNDSYLLELSDKLTSENKSTGLFYLSVGITPFAFLIIYLVFGFSILSYIIFNFIKHDEV